MLNYEAARRTKDHFQTKLLKDHPEIVSIAPRLKLDAEGRPTGEAVIVVGIIRPNALRDGARRRPKPTMTSIPTRLPVIDAQGKEMRNQMVEVIIEEEGEILAEMYTARRRPCPGGYSIGHPRVTAGTLGGVANRRGKWNYILSNNHVLAATNSGAKGDPIYQPGPADGGTATDTIGELEQWVPIDFSGTKNNEVDCAIAKTLGRKRRNVARHVQGIGTPSAEADATVGQAVRKSGRTTQLTRGIILSDNATIRVRYGRGQLAVFVNQLQYTHMTLGGDSGSLIWDQNSLTVVGLHFAGSGTSSYGNKIKRVLTRLGTPRLSLSGFGRRPPA
jgi:hypothetical protein